MTEIKPSDVEGLLAEIDQHAAEIQKLRAENERLRKLVDEREAASARVRSRCDAIHTASREWDVSARPGGLLRCCEVTDLLDGREDQS